VNLVTVDEQLNKLADDEGEKTIVPEPKSSGRRLNGLSLCGHGGSNPGDWVNTCSKNLRFC